MSPRRRPETAPVGSIWAALNERVAQTPPTTDVWTHLAERVGPAEAFAAKPTPVTPAAEAGVRLDPDAAGRCTRCGHYCPDCAPPAPSGWAVLGPTDRPAHIDDRTVRSALAALEPPDAGQGRARRISPVDRVPSSQRRPRRLDDGGRA